jgi:copper oxidase (laccase) domain-containing protein
MAALEIDLEQGWAKGLQLQFCNREESKALSLSQCFHLKQVHSAEWVEWSPDYDPAQPKEADAVLIRDPRFRSADFPVLIKSADCLPIFFIDRESEAIVAMHSGWRGVQKELPFLPFEKGWCQPKSTWIWVGPSLSGRDFGVREDMWSQFPASVAGNTAYFERDAADPTQRYFHVWQYLEDRWRALGVELIYNLNVNTFQNQNFCSWRRDFKAGLTKPACNNYSLLRCH